MLKKIKKILSEFKPLKINGSPLKKAAVFLPIIVRDKRLFILFTKRTNNVAVHKGQFSFPGGHCEKEDKSKQETALRELKEEIGIDEDSVEIIGCLNDIETITDFHITPFVGVIDNPVEYKLDAYEIERVIEVPIEFLMDENNWDIKEYNHEGKTRRGHYCVYQNNTIWGATAQILKRFIAIISD